MTLEQARIEAARKCQMRPITPMDEIFPPGRCVVRHSRDALTVYVDGRATIPWRPDEIFDQAQEFAECDAIPPLDELDAFWELQRSGKNQYTARCRMSWGWGPTASSALFRAACKAAGIVIDKPTGEQT